MKKQTKIITIIVIVFTLFSIFAIPVTFYFLAYIDSGDYISIANTCDITEWENPSISQSNMQLLQFVSKEQLQAIEDPLGDVTARTHIKKQFKITHWNKICFTAKITVSVENFYSGEPIDKYQGTRKLNFVFEDFKWKVESVEVID